MSLRIFSKMGKKNIPHINANRIFRRKVTNSNNSSDVSKLFSKDSKNLTDNERAKLEYELKLKINAFKEKQRKRKIDLLLYGFSGIIAVIGLSYASVPLYKTMCQQMGFSGTPVTDKARFTPDKLIPVNRNKRIKVVFTSNTSDSLPWKFVPEQRSVSVLPGETALAFYKATNKTDRDMIGVATYSVTPSQVAQYFSKIQCFCFEEQQLLGGETVDMPVFFFIDPDFAYDPEMKDIDNVVLHYTFFRAKHDNKGILRPIDEKTGNIIKDAPSINLSNPVNRN